MNLIKCPVCGSQKRIELHSTSTLTMPITTYDENGNRNYQDDNIITTYYQCYKCGIYSVSTKNGEVIND